jgi:hypothetical protein
VANNVNAFLERLTGAAGQYNKAKVGTVQALQGVFLDVRPEVARKGQTIRVYFPDVQAFTDQAANDWFPDDVNPNYVDVPFGQRPGKAILIRDFEQFQTSTDIIEQFIDPNYKRALEFANAQIWAQVNTTNFSASTTPAGYGAINTLTSEVDVTSAKLAWNILKRNKVPLTGPEDASILYHTDVHANTLTDTAWYQESLVSAVLARGIREDAGIVGQRGGEAMGDFGRAATGGNTAFQFARRDDQQAPTSTTLLAGTVTLTGGTPYVVTSSGTGWTVTPTTGPGLGPVVAGSWLTFSSSNTSITDSVSYPVSTVASTSTLNLGIPYGGSLSGGGLYAYRTTYTGIAMHRYAIALAVRPLEIVNDGNIRSRLVMIQGLPMRLMLSYQHLKAGWLLTLDYGMVCAVIRPDFGVILQS